MKKHIKFLGVALSLALSIAGCEEESNCDYAGCDTERRVIKTAQDATGRISVLDARHPDIWVIVSEEGVIGESGVMFDGPDIVIPCSLPEDMKEVGLKVVFSGELQDSCNEFESSTSEIYYSDIKEIQLAEDL